MTDVASNGLTDVDVLRGLLYAHDRANANTAVLHQASATLDAVVETLIAEGVLDRATLDERRQAAGARREQQFYGRGMAVALQEFDVGKYEFEGGAEIDCDSRLELCGAACCKLPLALSREDVEEGVLRWELGSPYMLARGGDGYCVHMDRCTHQCGVYEQRPIPCRGYDCRNDNRIWLDFDRRIVNPAIHEPDWPASLRTDPRPEQERD
jgi:Putative zinc- or iron-chelating domain